LTDKAGSGESQAEGGTRGGGEHQNEGHALADKQASASAPAHAAEAHDSIAQNLRKVYQSTVDEPVPDSIADLLSRLS
jgi:hypothetical protein